MNAAVVLPCIRIKTAEGSDHKEQGRGMSRTLCEINDSMQSNLTTSPWMRQSAWLRIVHSGDCVCCCAPLVAVVRATQEEEDDAKC